MCNVNGMRKVRNGYSTVFELESLEEEDEPLGNRPSQGRETRLVHDRVQCKDPLGSIKGLLVAQTVKVKQSRYRPDWPRRFQEVKVPRFHDNGTGKIVSLTHRSPLPPGNTPGTHFC
jgi:hypothetical protein